MGLKTFRPEVDSALNLMKLNEKIGIQNEARIFDDPVHLCNFAAKFANYDETASVFEPQLQLTV